MLFCITLLFYKTTKRIHLRFKKMICIVLRRKVLINKCWRVLIICLSFMIRMITKVRALWSLYLKCFNFNSSNTIYQCKIKFILILKCYMFFYTVTKKRNNQLFSPSNCVYTALAHLFTLRIRSSVFFHKIWVLFESSKQR